MSDDQFKVQWSVSLPPAAQYAKGDMLNIRGNSVEEVQAMFDQILQMDSEFIESASNVANLLRAAQVVTEGLSQPAAAEGGAEEGPPASSTGRRCKHGIRTRREGNGSRGKWVGYFCPLKKGDPDQCKPEFEDAN